MNNLTPEAVHQAKYKLLNEGHHPAFILMTKTGRDRFVQLLGEHNLIFGKIPMYMAPSREQFLGIPIHIVEGLPDDAFLLVDRETVRFWIYDLMERP